MDIANIVHQILVDRKLEHTCGMLARAFLDTAPNELGTCISDDQMASVMSLATAFATALITEHTLDHGGECAKEFMKSAQCGFHEAVVEQLDDRVERGEISHNPLKGTPHNQEFPHATNPIVRDDRRCASANTRYFLRLS